MSLTPSSELRARILEAARREPVRTRPQGVRARALTLAAGFLAPVLLSLLIGGPNPHGRPAAYEWLVAASFAALAGVATWAGVGQGRSMLGRPMPWRVAVAVLTPLALLLVTFAASVIWPETTRGHDTPHDLVVCLAFTTLFALGPLVAFTLVRRGSDPVAPRLSGAALAMAAGAWGAVGITLHCPHVTVAHIVLGHLVPVVAIGLAGLLVGQQIVAIRTKTG
jgi:hypothetical protein